MLLAELEIWHSRPIAPTRRVALGRAVLPVDPAPGYGGLLLGGIVAAHVGELEPELATELHRLVADLEAGRRIPQPRLRHRYQADRHGLARSRHRLLADGEALTFRFDGEGAAASQVLGALYAAGDLPVEARSAVMATVRRGVRWRGPVGPSLVPHLLGTGDDRHWAAAVGDPSRWALGVLGFDQSVSPPRREVQRRFRTLLRDAHPDHGGSRDGAAARIADLTAARRILLST